MHYCCEIVTKEFPTDLVIAHILLPFEWESHKDDEPQPVFTLYFQNARKTNEAMAALSAYSCLIYICDKYMKEKEN